MIKRQLFWAIASFALAAASLAGITSVDIPSAHAAGTCYTPYAGDTSLGTDTVTYTIPTTATYTIWTRMMADVPADNSYLLQIDCDTTAISVGGTNLTAGAWSWVNYRDGNTNSKITDNLVAGSHTFELVGQDPNVAIDRVIFATDPNCVPTGTGDNCAVPATTPTPTPTPTATPTSTPAGTIGITGVSNGQTLTGNATISATPVNATGVNQVNFYLDGTLAKTDTSSPYCYVGTTTCSALNTATLSNGAHTMYATMTYSGGTATSPTVSFSVNNTATVAPTPTSTPVPALGDANGDRKVNVTDLSIILSHWATNYAAADFNHDGTISVTDLSILLSHWTG